VTSGAPERTTFFDVWGPFDLVDDGGWITASQERLWDDVEERYEGLSHAIGCYMFCLQTPRRIKPWYVGMTLAQRGFRGEAFQLHKLNVYNEVIHRNGTPQAKPVLFFFSLMTPSRRLSRAGTTGARAVRWMERYLMIAAFARNPAIANLRDMTFLRQVEVPGLLGMKPGRPDHDVQAVRRALFGTTRKLSSRG